MFVSEGSMIDVSKKASFFSINRGKFHKHKRKNDRVSENKDKKRKMKSRNLTCMVGH